MNIKIIVIIFSALILFIIPEQCSLHGSNAKESVLMKTDQHGKIPKNANEEFKNNLSKLDLFAVWITEKVGSVGFFLIVCGWTFTWLLWNTFGPRWGRFDPYPGFVLWLFMSNVIQLVLLPLLMVGQNLTSMRMNVKNNSDHDNIEYIIEQNREIINLLEGNKVDR